MNKTNYDELVKQVKQHEEVIVQLLEMIAATNRRLSDLDLDKQANIY